MKLRILYHGNCFDGVSSAAVFSKFYLAKISPGAEIFYTPTMHKAGNAFDREQFDGDENAIVDFKYSPDERLDWWFDHHQSAFLSPEDEAHFYADRESGRKFWDPASKSCTEFIAEVARARFGFHDDALRPLVHWAHIIDGALYESAAQVVELAAPALQLMQVIESVPGDNFIEWIIRELTTRPLDEVAADTEVQRRFQPILAQHRAALDIIRRKSVYTRGVVQFDLVEEGFEGFNKFIPYYVHPETTYSVAVTRGAQRSKISVGSNPFSPHPRRHNIASICERYGGGGHAVVGAVSMGVNDVERAREVAREIVAELSGGMKDEG